MIGFRDFQICCDKIGHSFNMQCEDAWHVMCLMCRADIKIFIWVIGCPMNLENIFLTQIKANRARKSAI